MLPTRDRLPDGTLAERLKQVPAVPLPPMPREPTLIESIVDDLKETSGHDTELTEHLG